jgi:hypothetical protein
LAVVAIHEDLVATLGAEAISHLSVTHYFQEGEFATWNPEITFPESIRKQDDCHQTLLLALDEQPFVSMRQ